MPLRYWALIVLLGLTWGGSFLLNAILLRDIGPVSVSMGRVGLGALGCWLLLLARGRPMRLPLRTVAAICAMGVVMFALPFAIYPISQQHLPSGVAGIINAMTPILVVIVSQVWPGGERANLPKVLGVVMGFGGIVVLSLPYMGKGHATEIWAVATALCAPLCYGIAGNMARNHRAIDAPLVAAWALTGATVFIAPLALALEGLPRIERPETWGALLVIGFGLTSAAFIAFYWLLARAGATASSTVTFVAPLSAVFLGAWILGEAVRPAHLVGMAAIFLGLVLIDGRLVRRITASGKTEVQPGS